MKYIAKFLAASILGAAFLIASSDFLVGCTKTSTPSAVFGLVKLGDGNYHPVAQFKTMAECVDAAKKAYAAPNQDADTTKIVLSCGAVYDQPR
jgi:hypothetical protein